MIDRDSSEVLRALDVLSLPAFIVDNGWTVLSCNDNVHTFDEVILQLRKATGCGASSAESKAHEVHTRGRAIVFEGELCDCLRVTSVLEEIALHTQIEF